MKVCNCNECVKERFEHERLRILMKLTPQELHLINLDVKEQKILWMLIGVGLGTILGMCVMAIVMVV